MYPYNDDGHFTNKHAVVEGQCCNSHFDNVRPQPQGFSSIFFFFLQSIVYPFRTIGVERRKIKGVSNAIPQKII